MSIQLMNVFDLTVKRDLVNGFNEFNSEERTPVLEYTFFHEVGPEHLSLMEGTTHAGFVSNKIEVTHLLPPKLSIRDFKGEKKHNSQIPMLTDKAAILELVSCFNSSRDIQNADIEQRYQMLPETLTEDVFRDFMLFCKVYGFWVLTWEEVSLLKQDGVLYISVDHTHSTYKGTLEVLV